MGAMAVSFAKGGLVLHHGKQTSIPTTFRQREGINAFKRNRRSLVLRAEQQDSTNQETNKTDEERRVEAFESSLRAKKGSKPSPLNARQSNADMGGPAEWKEGQLFPEGWEEMDVIEKVSELYVGRRGFLFWSNKLAFGGVIALAFAWVVFRFVGPALGLYQLANDISTPNF